MAAELETDAALTAGKQEALRGKAKALEQVGSPTTVAGFRYILDNGRTLDVELSYPESLPPAKSPPQEVTKTELERPLPRLMEKVGNTSLCSSRETVYKAALDKAAELELSNT